jgi:hypothetical protein
LGEHARSGRRRRRGTALLVAALAGCRAAAPEPAPAPAEPASIAAPARPALQDDSAARALPPVTADAPPTAEPRTSAAIARGEQAQPRTAAADRRARAQRSMRAMSIVGRAFQADDDPTRLTFGELERSFDAYDKDGDQAITAAEFAARPLPSRAGSTERQSEEEDPWSALLAGLDGDLDGALDFDELEAFFIRRDDGDGVWRLEGRSR